MVFLGIPWWLSFIGFNFAILNWGNTSHEIVLEPVRRM